MAELADDDPRDPGPRRRRGQLDRGGDLRGRPPERFLQMGIAEQNMLGVAAGLATLGFVPIVSSFACFVVARALDSVRVLIAQPGLNVKIMGGYTGLLTGMTGKTHQIFNDIAIMRTLAEHDGAGAGRRGGGAPGHRAMVSMDGPVYIQMTREPSPVLFGPDYRFEIGRSVTVREGADVTLMSTGVQTARVLRGGRDPGRPGHRGHRPARPDDQAARRGGHRPGRPGQRLRRGGGGPNHARRARWGGERSALGPLPGLCQEAGDTGRLRRKRAATTSCWTSTACPPPRWPRTSSPGWYDGLERLAGRA